MDKKGKIYVLKRSNGFYGIYVNGTTQEHLACNDVLSTKTESFFNRIMLELKDQAKKGLICEIIFTEDEDKFKSGLPSFQEYLGMEGTVE